MKKQLLVLILCICSIQMFYSQENDGVVALNLPIRNSITFNRFNINPTFSFVREQNKYISISNKREWVQFDDAPTTYLASYSGRFGENIGAGVGVFQQNYGVLTTFGGILNFAYNVRLARDSNLTFGLNIGAYKSGLNTGSVITNFDDLSIENVPENFLAMVNPGINYGTGFFDFGISLKNIVAYNFQSSTVIEDNPEQGLQGHIMYTGYLTSRGFFDESKFTTLVKSEFKKEETIISAIVMITIPKGIWAQAGYNSIYGASAGLGLNISPQIAIEYNFEKAIGDLSIFETSHEISLAYRFKNTENYRYSSGDEVSSLISGNNRKRKKKKITRIQNDKKVVNKQKAKEEADAQAALLAEQKAKEDADAQAALLAEQKAKEDADAQATLLAKQKAKEEADAQATLLAEQKAKEEADAQAALLAEQKAKEEADAQAALLAKQKAKEEADAQAALLAEQKAKEDAAAQAALLAKQKAKEEANAQAALLAEQKAKEDADAQAALLAEQKAKEEADVQAALLAEQKAKEDADAQASLLAEQKAKEDADAQASLLAEQKAKEEADALAALLAKQKAKEDADAQAALLAEQKAKEEADAQAALLAEQKAKEDADAQAALLAEQKAKEEQEFTPTDKLGEAILNITKQAEKSKTTQSDLLQRFDDIVEIKNKDLQDLKEENDLSEQGIAVKPKPFKSISEENNTLNAIKSDLEKVITARNEEIKALKKLKDDSSEDGVIMLDNVELHYKKTIKRLESEQKEAIKAKNKLDKRLKDINVSTEFERRRRIKRAAFDNEDERYTQDRDALKRIKENTVTTTDTLTVNDFDFGEKQSDNIQILENVKNVESGYYLVLAIHSDVNKRDAFLTKVVQSGFAGIDFFYDINSSKYYIYYAKFDNIQDANNALNAKGNNIYNANMSIVKIEN
ncbi:PorP/SprF family type IX secretion system membrane protein [Lacinutrix algicola]|uniref:PorP/SprF family type IX secretion system membrane protein n=1 Tax=Lacinutrix algicola TaxID=342954 RepID=UPI0006E1DBA8|nr:PorP/SprF family type IX secretion system membrane protein [Lacinutrix algicola]